MLDSTLSRQSKPYLDTSLSSLPRRRKLYSKASSNHGRKRLLLRCSRIASVKSFSYWPRGKRTRKLPRRWASASRRRKLIGPPSCGSSGSTPLSTWFTTRFVTISSSRDGNEDYKSTKVPKLFALQAI